MAGRRLKPPWRRLGVTLECLGRAVGECWSVLEAVLKVLDRLGGILEAAEGGVLGLLGAVLRRVGSVLGGRWRCVEVFWKVFESFRASRERLGGGRAASYATLAQLWSASTCLGASLGCRGANWK